MAISIGKVMTVGIIAVNMEKSMQKNNMAELLYTFEASLPTFQYSCKQKQKLVWGQSYKDFYTLKNKFTNVS